MFRVEVCVPADHLIVLVLMQDCRVVFKSDSGDDEVGRGQGQTRSSK